MKGTTTAGAERIISELRSDLDTANRKIREQNLIIDGLSANCYRLHQEIELLKGGQQPALHLAAASRITRWFTR